MTTHNPAGPGAILLGQRLGSYQLEALIGRGGMAAVYRALDTNLQRRVAIKLLAPAAAAQPGFRDRFLQEARLIAGLRHPNIVQVYDLGEHQGTPYMVQELLPGPTLEQRLRDSAARGARLVRADVLSIVGQLAAALDAAHAAGLIHRDVKPANAMWGGSGTLVLTDFGIAKQLQGGAHHTQAGTVFGTPSYLSPEQAQGLPLSPASDVYSLGVVLYELLAGRPPFVGAAPLSVVVDHVHTPPPSLGPLAPGLPPAVEAVVQQALAKQPAARFQSAGALATALEQAWGAPLPAAVAPAGLHEQPTSLWQAPPAAHGRTIVQAPAPPMTQPAPPAPPRAAPVARPAASASPIPPAPRRRSLLLPLLGGALLLVLLAGAALAARGPADPAAPGAPTAAPSVPAEAALPSPEPAAPTEPPAAPTEPPAAPTEPPAAPTEPPAAPTEPIAAPTEPPAAPTEPIAAPTEPIAALRALFAEAAGDGRESKPLRELGKRLDEVERALAKEDGREAARKLRELQRRLIEGGEKQELDPALVQQGLAGVEAIAATYGLSLAPERGSGDDDDDDDDDEGEGDD